MRLGFFEGTARWVWEEAWCPESIVKAPCRAVRSCLRHYHAAPEVLIYGPITLRNNHFWCPSHCEVAGKCSSLHSRGSKNTTARVRALCLHPSD